MTTARGRWGLVGLATLAAATAACGSSSSSPADGSAVDANGAPIGRPCDIGFDGGFTDAGTVVATISSPALDCASRICLVAPVQKAAEVASLCSAPCASDLDCAAGERGDPNDPADQRCKAGFVCMVPSTVGSFACMRMCVCTDSLVVPSGGFQIPPICASADGG